MAEYPQDAYYPDRNTFAMEAIMKRGQVLFVSVLLVSLGAVQHAQARLFGNASESWPEYYEDAWGAAAADVDGDGDLDVVLAQDGLNRLLLHRAGGVFLESLDGLPADADRTVDVALFDVDGDGDVDLVAANFDTQNRLYLNDGSGHFTDATVRLPPEVDRSVDLSIGDVDGDGDLDILVGNSTSQQNRLYLNQGNGVFFDGASLLPADADRTVELVLADLDNDGDLDALAANDLSNRKYLNVGGAQFIDATGDLPLETDESYGLDVGDVDLDGDLDALIGNLSGVNRLHFNDGSGVFVDDPLALPVVVNSTYVVRLLDIDGDADLDLLLGNEGVDELYENDGFGLFSDISSRLPDLANHTRAFVSVDWDADGDLDLLSGTVFNERDTLYRNAGGTFVDVTHGDDLASGVELQALADFDGDGDLDGAGFSVGATTTYSLFVNDGSGQFVSDAAALPIDNFSFPAFGDLDQDGHIDLLLGYDDVGQARFFVGDGDGSFVDATGQLPVNGEYLGPVALGDLDGDGDLDAYLGNSPGLFDTGQDRVYLNDGNGGLTDAGGVPVEGDRNVATSLVDLDGDGDLDVLIAGGQSGKRMWRNAGNATFADASGGLPVTTNNCLDLSVGDIDDDGDIDAFFSVFGFAELYLNDGSGAFVDVAGTQLPPLLFAIYSALEDLDGDGDRDLLLQHLSPTGPLGLFAYENDGFGFFTLLDDAVEPTQVSFLGLAADLDGDGVLDIPLQSRIFQGWRHHVTAVGAAVRGSNLLFDLRGSVGAPWILAYSTGSARIDVPPFGTLLIDPSGSVELGRGFLDSEGAGELLVAVPGDPVLSGTVVFLQATVGLPYRLTNLEITVLE